MQRPGQSLATPSLPPITVAKNTDTSAFLNGLCCATRTCGALLSLTWCVGYVIIGHVTEIQQCDSLHPVANLSFYFFFIPVAFACVCCSCSNADSGVCRRVPGKVLRPFKISYIGTVWGFEIMFLVASAIYLERLYSGNNFRLHMVSMVLAILIHILKWKFRHIQSNRRMKLFWGLSVCLVIEFDAVFINLNNCNVTVIFPMGMALVRISAALFALFWTPPVANSERRSDTVVVEPSAAVQKNGFYAGAVHVRRLNQLEKFSGSFAIGTRVRLKQHGKWLRRISCCCSMLFVAISTPSFVYGFIDNQESFQLSELFYFQ